MLIVSPALLQAMSVPSLQAPAQEPSPIYTSGGSSGRTAVRVIMITLYAGLTIAGVVKLTDDNPDNNLLGFVLISPVIMEGILYLVLDENGEETLQDETTLEKEE